MKKLTENTFTEGLVQDLHPLTTPNNVLTDALNATLITMNGNEFVLLNDMGNGRVEKAYLPSGYVPVGIKEYGGVIYVASYNPLTNKGQIGSFPSPERNIDLEEVGTASTSISWDSFYDKEKCKTFIVKTELFGGKILRSGDKFTIYFNSDLESKDSLNYTLNLLSNYSNSNITRDKNYIESGKAKSPKNNFFSIYLTVLDSNNNLRDITLQLKRFIPEENVPLEFDASILPVVKNNTGYFILKLESIPDLKDNNFIKERQKRAVNTYNNKLFGKIYLTVLLNIIDHINVSVYGYKKKEDDTWVIPNDLNLGNLENNDAVLIFDTEYIYNCPDGFTDESNKSTEVIPGYSGYYGDYEKSAIKGIQLNSKYLIDPVTLPFPKSNSVPPKYNIIENLYTLKLTAYLPLKIQDNDSIFDYTITPWMIYSPLTGLSVTGSINLNKLGDGTNTISTWKYYCDNNHVRITWGFNSYPGYGVRILNVVFHFYDILYENDKEVGNIKIDPRSSYNGSFTLNIGYEELIQRNSLYLVIISYEESSDLGNIKYAGARWLLTNGVFNSAYFNILDFNNLVGDVLSLDEVYSDNTYTDDYGNVYNRYEFIEEFKNLIRIDKLDIISYNKFDKDYINNTSEGNIYIQEDSLLTKYLSKRNITKFKSNLRISTSPLINSNYPFELNLNSIKYTFNTNNYKLDYDDLTVYGNENSVVDSNNNKIFIVNNLFGTPNIYNTLSASVYENILAIECTAYSQICNYTVLGTLMINNCFKSFLGRYNFPSVFGFDLPTDSLLYPKSGFSLGTGYKSGGALTSSDYFWVQAYIASLNSKNTYDFTSKDQIGRDKHGNGDVIHRLADHRNTITELIKNNLGSPVIACMVCLPNYKPGNTGVYNSYGKPEGAALMKKDDRNGVDHINSILSYIIYFWKSEDGLYYPVNRFSQGTSMKSFIQIFQKFYINTQIPENVQITLMKPDDLIYMEDFNAIVNVDILCKSERVKKENLFILKRINLDYLSTLIKNTKNIIENVIGDEKLVDNFNKFISGVWFITNANYSKSILYNCSFKVTGTTYDYLDLLNLNNPISSAVITESGKVISLDYMGDPLINSSIYYYDNDKLKLLSKVYPTLISKLTLGTNNGATLILVSAELLTEKYHGTKRNNYSSDHWWEWSTYRFVNLSSIMNSNDYYQLT